MDQKNNKPNSPQKTSAHKTKQQAAKKSNKEKNSSSYYSQEKKTREEKSQNSFKKNFSRQENFSTNNLSAKKYSSEPREKKFSVTRKPELSIYGEKAVRTLIKIHPEKVERFFYRAEFARDQDIKDFLVKLSEQKKIFRKVEDEQLEKISTSIHHQGLTAIIKKPSWNNVHENNILDWQDEKTPLIFLNGIANPHNLGAIFRSAAFFGLTHVILEKSEMQAFPSASVWKNAAGGMEYLHIYQEKNLPRLLSRLKDSHHIAAATVNGNRLLNSVLKEEKRPFALVLGNEENGLSKEVEQCCQSLISIHGTSNIESLNVATAAGIFFKEMFKPKKIVLKNQQKKSAKKVN